MPKRKDTFLSNLIEQVASEAELDASRSRKIVDIITFCEHDNYLNLNQQSPPLKLWPMQKIVLKLFYRGSRGNEHLQLTEEELKELHDIAQSESLDYDKKKGGFNQVIEKYHRGALHNELLLVMGRRSSKTLMVSIIAAYESYKLLESPDGNPHQYFTDMGLDVGADKPLTILNVAVSESQAYDPLFLEIESRLTRSNYFPDKINYKASKKGTIYLLSESDKRENNRRRKLGINLLLEGSVVLMSGHSNSNSLRGKAAPVVLFDEFAHFINSSGRQSGDEAYRALTPSVKQFGEHGRIVLLSDPKGRDGKFWKLFEMSQDREQDENGEDKLDENGNYIPAHDEVLALQVPTWRMNPNPKLAKKVLEREEKSKDPLAFASTWGARFLGEEGIRYFDERKITNCIDFSLGPTKQPNPKYTYHIHLDPATTSHNYALVMTHAATYINEFQHVKRRVFVDLVKFWTPSEQGPVDIMDVEKTVRALCRRFKVGSVTFDQWNSAQTIQRLRASGINAKETKFTTTYIASIYGELKSLINMEDLVLYPHRQLVGELKHLKYKILRSGFQRFFDPESEFPSDDCSDALAGSAYMALNHQVRKPLPRGVLVHFRR